MGIKTIDEVIEDKIKALKARNLTGKVFYNAVAELCNEVSRELISFGRKTVSTGAMERILSFYKYILSELIDGAYIALTHVGTAKNWFRAEDWGSAICMNIDAVNFNFKINDKEYLDVKVLKSIKNIFLDYHCKEKIVFRNDMNGKKGARLKFIKEDLEFEIK